MRISCVRTYMLTCPLEEPFNFSQWQYSAREALLVRITSDDGVDGWGECYGPAAPTQAAISTFYAPRLLGMNALQTDVVWHDLWRSSLDFARRGLMMGAMSGIDMALWDLKGKVHGEPVSSLMCGRVRDRLPCYATGMYFRDRPDHVLIDELVGEAGRYHGEGFKGLKIKIGRNPGFDVRLVQEMRRALPDAVLMADSNHAYDLPEATAIGRVLEDQGFAWFEEPLSPEHPQLYRQLHDAVRVPLAAGESEQTRFGFQQLLAPGGIDIAQPDLAYCGGPSEGMKIRAVASSLGINVVPHVWGTMINLAAAAHFLASDYRYPGRAEQHGGILECDRTPNPLRDEVFSSSLVVEDGCVEVPSGPGLGIEVDLKAMQRFCGKEEEVS